MAQTYTWNDLITYVSQSNPRIQSEVAGALLCDMVNSFIWGKADWRVSLKVFPPFYIVPLVQDYVPPYIKLPSDFLGVRGAQLVYNGTEPPTTYPPLMVDRYLQKTYAQGRTTSVSYEATTGGIRVYPRPPAGIGPDDYQIELTYKTNPTKVTAATLMNTLPFDDQYFQTYVEGMKYFAKPPAQQRKDDLDMLLNMLDIMAAHEAVNLGDQNISPKEPLVGYDWW